MTPQEIIREIQKLPFEQKKEVISSVSEEFEQKRLTEDEFEQILFAEGIVGKPPNLDEYTNDDEDFEPIEIEGEPISETIIRERR